MLRKIYSTGAHLGHVLVAQQVRAQSAQRLERLLVVEQRLLLPVPSAPAPPCITHARSGEVDDCAGGAACTWVR